MAEATDQRRPIKQNHQNHQKPEKPPSWTVFKSLFACRNHQTAPLPFTENRKKCNKIGCSGSLCSLRDNSKVMHRPETCSSETFKKRVSTDVGNASTRSMKPPLSEINGGVSSSSSASSSAASVGGSFRGINLSRLSGCYECHMVIDPINGVTRDPSLRATVFTCTECGEIFMNSEKLELHQTVRHAVSELSHDDGSRNIVEIIFQSSWLKKQAPVCKIDRILKVHNTQKTITKFEDYRDSIKAKANKLPKKHPRCIADGNELLRFHCATFVCSIGMNGSSNLCNSIPHCNVCSIIKCGFKTDGLKGICTTATSGKAHDNAQISSEEEKKAMLVCRVIAGRVKKNQEAAEEFDSVAGSAGLYSNLDELCVESQSYIALFCCDL